MGWNPGTGRYIVARMTIWNGGPLSLGPIPSGSLKNLNDIDKWSSLSLYHPVRRMSVTWELGLYLCSQMGLTEFDSCNIHILACKLWGDVTAIWNIFKRAASNANRFPSGIKLPQICLLECESHRKCLIPEWDGQDHNRKQKGPIWLRLLTPARKDLSQV